MVWRRIWEIFRKEILQSTREPRMRFLLLAPPLVQLIIFGYAVNLDVENNRIGWLDRDQTPESRRLLAAFQGSRYVSVGVFAAGDEEVRTLLDAGRVHAVVTVPSGWARDLQRGRRAPVQVLVDGTNSNTASLVSAYIGRIVSDYSLQNTRLVPAVQLESRVFYNPDLRSRNYFVPGVVVNIIGLVTIALTAMAIVREKEIGTMEQLMVTPIRPVELMLGKTLPFALIGLLEVALITGAALLIFSIPFEGSALLLLAGSVLFIGTTLGAGLLISTVSRTQQQAMMGSFFFFLPAFMLSGFAFPIGNMPEPIQYLTYLNPLRYYLEIVRGIFLKGTGLDDLWPQMLILAVFAAGTLAVSSIRFHKRLD